MFFLGMEISPKRLAEGWRIAIIRTLFQILASVGLAWLIGLIFGWSMSRIVLLGFVISLSSTAVVLKLLKDRGELDTPAGRDVLLILLVQDLAVVPMLIVIGLLGGQAPDTPTLALQIAGGMAIFGGAGWLIHSNRFHFPFADKLRHDHELQVFAALLSCFGLAFITGWLQISFGWIRNYHRGGVLARRPTSPRFNRVTYLAASGRRGPHPPAHSGAAAGHPRRDPHAMPAPAVRATSPA